MRLLIGTEQPNREVLNTPFMTDITRAFIYVDHMGQNQLMGTYLQTVYNFAYYNNFNLNLHLEHNMEQKEVYKRIAAGQYNLSVNGGIVNYDNKLLSYSYSMELLRECIMVPLEDELPKYWYVVWPYGRYIYLVGMISSILLAVLMRYFDLPNKRSKKAILRNLLHSTAIFLYCSNMNIRVPNAPCRVQIFYGWLMIIGFIISAYYLPYLTSYHMKPIFMPPINTVEQLLQAKISVLVPSYDFDEMRHFTNENMHNLNKLLKPVSFSHFQELLKNFNRSFAYVVSQDQWTFLNRQQRNLIKPYFHLSPICFGSAYNAFPIQSNATFKAKFNEFIRRVHESGF